MARSFNGSSDFGTANLGGLFGLNKVSVVFWLYQNAFGSGDNMAMELSTNATQNAGSFFIDPNSGGFAGNVELLFCNPSTQFYDVIFPQPSAAAWHHWAVLIDASIPQITHAYIDGVDQSLTLKVGNATAGTFNIYTLYFMSRAGTSLFNAGRMALAAVYGGYLLTAGEVLSLAKGAQPYQVGQRATIFSYWSMDGLVSPEPDTSGNGRTMTLTGTALAAGPPAMPFTPRWHRYLGWTPALPASGLGWIINRRNKLMVPKKRA